MTDTSTLISLTADIVSAFVSNNSAHAADLPDIIGTVHASLVSITTPKQEAAPAEPLVPAVSVKKSVTDEYIISLEDGRKFKSMKRYLAGLGMTPDDYRAKWGLPRDYPMVAPGYAAKRSELAKAVGLGRKPEVVAEAPAPVQADTAAVTPIEAARETEEAAPARRRGRPSKKAA